MSKITKQDIADKATEIFDKYVGEDEVHFIDNGNFWVGSNKGYGTQYAQTLGCKLYSLTKEQLVLLKKDIADKIKADKSKATKASNKAKAKDTVSDSSKTK